MLRTLVFTGKQVANTDEQWYSVRIMPYRTTEDVIGGVMITFSNITAVKALEAEFREKITPLEAKNIVERLDSEYLPNPGRY